MARCRENLAFEAVTAAANEVFEDCNLSRSLPSTPLCEGVTGLVFRRCNLLNARLPPDARAEGCLTAQKDLCAWEHPAAGLPEEPEHCRHVVEVLELVVDEKEVVREYVREDTLLG